MRPIKQGLKRGFIDLHICHCRNCKNPEIFEWQDRIVLDLGNGQLHITLRNSWARKNFFSRPDIWVGTIFQKMRFYWTLLRVKRIRKTLHIWQRKSWQNKFSVTQIFLQKPIFIQSDMCKKNCALSSAVAVQPLLVRCATPFTISYNSRVHHHKLSLYKRNF